MKIINLEKFKETVSNYDKPARKALLEYLAFHRVLCALVLVDVLRTCTKDGKIVQRTETLQDYNLIVDGERVLIGLLGRKEAAKVYGNMEGITSDIKTVDYILSDNAKIETN